MIPTPKTPAMVALVAGCLTMAAAPQQLPPPGTVIQVSPLPPGTFEELDSPPPMTPQPPGTHMVRPSPFAHDTPQPTPPWVGTRPNPNRSVVPRPSAIPHTRAGGRALTDTRLGDPWRVWVAENLMLGQTPDELVAVLGANGVPTETARAEVAALAGHPAVTAGTKLGQLVKRLEFTLHLEERLAELAPGGNEIPRVERLPAQTFYRDYYLANRPVVITGMPMPCWTPEGLAERFGDAEVEVCADREGDPALLRNLDVHARRLPFARFVADVRAAGETNDFYMVATNRNLAGGALAALIDEAPDFPGYFDATRREAAHYLWLGPKGTHTPLHHDLHNLVFCQVYGRKRFYLISPRETRLLYHEQGFTGDLDARKLTGARVHELELGPGEALFIPVGWWHQVHALDVSISFTLTNFVLPTEFEGLIGSLIRQPLLAQEEPA